MLDYRGNQITAVLYHMSYVMCVNCFRLEWNIDRHRGNSKPKEMYLNLLDIS